VVQPGEAALLHDPSAVRREVAKLQQGAQCSQAEALWALVTASGDVGAALRLARMTDAERNAEMAAHGFGLSDDKELGAAAAQKRPVHATVVRGRTPQVLLGRFEFLGFTPPNQV